jgi:ADP-ribose pyrophosphatase YjhB (NUDIX family)
MTSVVQRSARAILIDADGRLLLIRRSKEGLEPYWTTPGGGVEADDQSIEDALIRELREELGAEVDQVQQVFLASSPAGPGEEVAVAHFFACRLRSLDPALRSGPEFSEPARGGYDLDLVVIDAGGAIEVDLKPAALKAFIEANWVALRDAALRPAGDAASMPGSSGER